MFNRIIIIILVLIVLLTAAIGLHSYTLSQQIDALGQQINILNQRLTTAQEEQATRLDTIKGELAAFKSETLMELGSLEDDIQETSTRIATLQEELNEVAMSISQSIMRADEIYQQANQAVVRINDGDRTLGSGFILDAKGYVVTAYHVVEELSEADVVFSDGTISSAVIIGNCPFSDIAVLSLDKMPEVEPLRFGDSSNVSPGDPVVTIGNPFNLPQSLTSGIVSQLNRSVKIEQNSTSRSVPNLIQFDATVNFGNSGGPLLNSSGEVVGLVIARIDPERGEGIYYAVSSNKVKRVAGSIIEFGYFDYPWLGIFISNVTLGEADNRGLDFINGALVEEIVDGSPSDVAGIEVNDIIVAIDGQAITDVASLISYLAEYYSVGDDADINVIRSGDNIVLILTIGKRPS
ncbi:trypsin-like peptidase domain-containing protein [Chloroflexota bacterium]